MAYCWYFTQEDIENKTPSREDGMSSSVEARYRKDGSRFIINASNTLGLRHDTLATGVVYYHRFFMMQSFKQFDRWVVAAACLLLAGKVEETPKKCKDILKVTNSLLNEQQMRGFGSNQKEELLTHERILLQTIKFDLQLEHPYTFLLKYAKALRGEKAKIEKLVQMAWTFVNDSFSTTLCLQWEPQAIAVAFLYLAGKLTKFDLQSMVQSKSRSWWRQFVDTLDIHDLETICHQVLDLYGENKNQEEKEPTSQLVSEPSTTAPAPPPPPAAAAPAPAMKPIPLLQQQVPNQQNQSILGQPPSLPANPLAPPTSLPGTPPTTGTQGFQTQTSFFNPMGLSFMANPLQALQNLHSSSTNQQPAYPNQSYTTLNVSGVNMGTTAPQHVTAYGQLATHTTSPAIGNTGNIFLPSTPVGQRGLPPQQMVGQKLAPQQLTPQQMSVQTPQQRLGQHVMTPQQLGVQQLTPQQMGAQNLLPRQVNAQNLIPQQQSLTPQQLVGVSQLTPQQLNVQRLTPQQLNIQQLTTQQANIRQLTPQQLNTQHQSLLASNTVGIGGHQQLPQPASLIPGMRNIGTPGLPSQQPSSYTMLQPSQKGMVTAPHMMQPSLSTHPQLGTSTHPQLGTSTHPQLGTSTHPQLGTLTCTTTTIPNQAPPIMTQHHIPVTMPTGMGGGALNTMNVGANRVPQQLATPTRPPGQPMGGQYNMSGRGGWGVR